MIGFKKTPIRLVLITFLISVVSIILIYVDSLNNEPLAIEEITISRDLSESFTPIKSKQIHTVRKGDSLSVIFEDKQVPLNTAYKIFDFDKNNLLSSIIPGDIMEFNYMGNDLLSIEIIKDDVNSILIKTEDEISIVNIKKEAQTITSFGFGEIRGSFYKSAKDVGIPDSIIMDFAYIFGWDIDFIFDVRKGDKFSVIYETEFSEGEKISSGDIVFAELPEKGSNVEKDGTAGVVESTKAASDVYTPVSGEVVEINQSIVDDPSKINADPEGEAWFFKLKLKDKSELDTLMNKEEYDKFAKETSA